MTVEGPPAGVASGRYDVPKTAIAIVGALVVVVGLGVMVARVRGWWRRR